MRPQERGLDNNKGRSTGSQLLEKFTCQLVEATVAKGKVHTKMKILWSFHSDFISSAEHKIYFEEC